MTVSMTCAHHENHDDARNTFDVRQMSESTCCWTLLLLVLLVFENSKDEDVGGI